MLTYIIPTRDRPEELNLTLAALGALDHSAVLSALGGAEVIVVDNASQFPVTPPPRLGNGLPVRVMYRAVNEAAAARNAAAEAASGHGADPDHWLLMLDDDSAPIDTGFASVLAGIDPEVAAVGAEIALPSGRREHGGLPEVFIGCGAAIRRRAFLDAGGYDRSFVYYAEEYDLVARFLLAGLRVVHDRRFRVHHRKVASGRDMNAVLRRLVRNNACVAQRYAPDEIRAGEIEAATDRYRRIAKKEHALEGFEQGMLDLYSVIDSQPRREMTAELYDRFTGLAAARATLGEEFRRRGVRRAAIVERGKHDHFVERAVEECGAEIVPESRAEALVVGTLSPGPMLDAFEGVSALARVPVLTPWCFEGAASAVE